MRHYKTIFVVWRTDRDGLQEPRRYGGVFSTKANADARAQYLNENYTGHFHARELLIDWYVENYAMPPDEIY